MTTISLRNYNREAEILIDQGVFDEAINHCKHILKFYPKHVDTYRLLGKAYLDNKRYSEAADIFQRVLSVLPDDFVSQIGMSIIREDEGNFDAAIWHIERAFEVQPSNAAIQDEIRRLYGRRDGTHLAKIRLTRGALIRMYLQGELYNQAISETRAALADDPQRMDLEVLLAKLYYLSGKKVEAAEVCTKIIKKLPFCLEANKILSVILTSLDRTEEATIFQKRIYALQPYAAHISKNAPTINQVPDNAVTLDKLDPEFIKDTIEKQPAWAQTIGIEMEIEEEKSLPDWLPSLASERLIPDDEENEFPLLDEELSKDINQDVPEDGLSHDIPDWMKTAGWEKKTDANSHESPSVMDEMEELEAAEIPEWLQGLSPAENEISRKDEKDAEDLSRPEKPDISVTVPYEEESSLEAGEIPEWLQDISPGKPSHGLIMHKEAIVTPGEFNPEDILDPQPEEDPSSLFSSDEVGEKFNDDKDEFSVWLKTLEANANNADDSAAEGDEIPAMHRQIDAVSEGKPDTVSASLSEIPENTQVEEADEQIDEALDWLSSIADEQDTEQETITQSPEKNMGLPTEWIKEYVETEDDSSAGSLEKYDQNQDAEANEKVEPDPVPSEFAEDNEYLAVEKTKTKSAEEIDDAFAWLEALAAKQGADEQTLSTEFEQRDETPPEWLNSFTSDIDPIEETAQEPTLVISREIEEQEVSLPDVFSDSTPEKSVVEIKEEMAIQEPSVDEAVLAKAEIIKSKPETEKDNSTTKAENESIEAILSGLAQGNMDTTLPQIDAYIKQGKFLEEIILGLENAIIYQPLESPLYQVLGDAYAKNNQFQKALDSYSKAEELLF